MSIFEGNQLVCSERLNTFVVRGNRPGKPVQLQEYEIKYLCTKAREIFINQPILLELEAPIKICGACPACLVFTLPSLITAICHLYRRYPWPILRSFATVRVRRVPTRSQLPVPRRLCRPWQAITRDDLSPARV